MGTLGLCGRPPRTEKPEAQPPFITGLFPCLLLWFRHLPGFPVGFSVFSFRISLKQ